MISDHIIEEEKDAKMYLDMAEEFENEGHPGEAAILRDIAHEEMIHYKHLKNIEKNLAQNRTHYQPL